MNLHITSKYKFTEKIGGGGFGEVYKGNNTITLEDIAAKLESIDCKNSQLANEARVYKLLEGSQGIPYIKYHGTEENYNCLVMDLLGSSLEKLFRKHNKKFSLKTVLMLAEQIITRVEYLHNKNHLHRDLKPDNFVMGRSKMQNQVFLIDFGLAKTYCDIKTHEHIAYKDGKELVGTARYSSLNTHAGVEQTRRDDLEGIAYMLIYFIKGSLPWQSVKCENKREKNDKIYSIKRATSIEELCEGIPQEFATFLREVRGLEYDERPNYSRYRKLFRDLFIREGYAYDSIYDWTEIKEKPKPKRKLNSPRIQTENTLLNNNSRIPTVESSLIANKSSTFLVSPSKRAGRRPKTNRIGYGNARMLSLSLTRPRSLVKL